MYLCVSEILIYSLSLLVITTLTASLSDIVGFTQWSSERDPVDVFTLLETIYTAFDRVAVRRKVFKVETIGDCYVAVTGLPKPQPDHAFIMTKFANDMLNILPEELHKIAPALGPATLELAIRVGMHSGAVIAGVLRGEKARFQLFGDTMNTGTIYCYFCLLYQNQIARPFEFFFFLFLKLLNENPKLIGYTVSQPLSSVNNSFSNGK